MAGHTGGPWQVRVGLGGFLIDGPAGANQRIVRGSGGFRILADARLAAAAPDLLKVCERLLAGEPIAMLKPDLEAAVAKATGLCGNE